MMMSVATVNPSATGEFGDERFAKFGSALTAVFGQKEYQPLQRADVGPLDLLATAFLRQDESGLREHGQMGRECALGQPGCLNELSGRQAIRFVPNKEAKSIKPSGMRQST